MSDIVIKVEDLSKQYRLGQVGTGTFAHDLNRWWHKVRGKDDPYLRIGEENDRSIKGNSEYVWALRDINFEIKKGEVVGIVGNNGAGKSTLLKILSRTTAPTTGVVKAKGRVASLLEVGTGFHPELSGRENIYLNGAILGMTRHEINSKFDEIVDFSGVERYVDTPVKRYSSGMYVRLAFAVAAHLEPEILIVDEVLAVGDADFQRKALGKMESVSKNEGRTILFVSHNIPAIKRLCTRGILLCNGKISFEGNIPELVEKYQLPEIDAITYDGKRLPSEVNNLKSYFKSWKLKKHFESESLDNFSILSGKELNFVFEFESGQFFSYVEIGLVIRDSYENIIYSTNSRDYGGDYIDLSKGVYEFNIKTRLPIKPGLYNIDIVLVSNNRLVDQYISSTKLNIISKYESVLGSAWQGIVCEESSFNYEKVFEEVY